MKISILTPDLSHNCLGRAYLLAKILQRHYEVEIVGPVFGDEIWEPVANDKSITYKSVKICGMFKPYWQIKELIKKIEGDVIYASKPLFTSFGVGLFKKLFDNKPLVLDIDDWQLGLALSGGWTNFPALFVIELMESLVRMANSITVSSHFLKRKFGGHYIPHAVDTSFYDPLRYDPEKARKQLGVSEEVVVSFIGTPRKHKGVDTIIFALSKLLKKEQEDYKKFKFLFTGDPQDPYVKSLVNLSYRLLGKHRTLFLGLKPKAEEPHLLAASDIVVIPQKPAYASLGQVPAKVFTAMSMAKPIIASKISDLSIILEGCGILVPPGDVDALCSSLSFLIDQPDLARKLGQRARMKCLKEYSYPVVGSKLRNIVENLIR